MRLQTQVCFLRTCVDRTEQVQTCTNRIALAKSHQKLLWSMLYSSGQKLCWRHQVNPFWIHSESIHFSLKRVTFRFVSCDIFLWGQGLGTHQCAEQPRLRPKRLQQNFEFWSSDDFLPFKEPLKEPLEHHLIALECPRLCTSMLQCFSIFWHVNVLDM